MYFGIEIIKSLTFYDIQFEHEFISRYNHQLINQLCKVEINSTKFKYFIKIYLRFVESSAIRSNPDAQS